MDEQINFEKLMDEVDARTALIFAEEEIRKEREEKKIANRRWWKPWTWLDYITTSV